MEVQKEIIISVTEIHDTTDDNNIIYGQYTDDEHNSYNVRLSIPKKFRININQNLPCTFGRFSEPNHPLTIIRGYIKNKEIHGNAFPCKLIMEFQDSIVIPKMTIEQIQALFDSSTDTGHQF